MVFLLYFYALSFVHNYIGLMVSYKEMIAYVMLILTVCC